MREVRIAAALDHSNIVALFDSDEADGLQYYVMPYMDGGSLREQWLSAYSAARGKSAILNFKSAIRHFKRATRRFN